jgi:hypothetical protein
MSVLLGSLQGGKLGSWGMLHGYNYIAYPGIENSQQRFPNEKITLTAESVGTYTRSLVLTHMLGYSENYPHHNFNQAVLKFILRK